MSTALTVPEDRDDQPWDLAKVASTLDEKRKAIFLRTLANTANPMKAAKAAGYQSTTPINRAMRDDPNFAEEVAIATAAGGDFLESEAVDRATVGVVKGVYFKGERVDEEVVKSDSLLIRVLEAAKPSKYAERKDVKHTHEGTIGVAVIPMTMGSEADWERGSIQAHENQKQLVDPSRIIDSTCTEVAPANPQMKRG